jgi:hypothetical protein
MRKMTAVAVCSLALLPGLSHPAATRESFNLRNAQDLVDLCAVPEGDPMNEAARGFCYGFLSGAGAYHRAVAPTAKDKPLFCVPEPRPTREEAAKRFVDWAGSNAEHMQETPIDALLRFAADTWPCPETKR